MKTLVCFGDSITQGSIGDAYVRHIAMQMPHVNVINAGVDGDTTYNLFERLDTAVLRHNPAVVMVMVGLNDFGTAYGERLSRVYYRRVKKVPITIDIPAFETLYDGIIHRLLRAGITTVLCTPTTLGEIPDTAGQFILDGYVRVVKDLAQRHDLTLIDVRAAFVQAMRSDPRVGPEYHLWRVPIDAWRVSRGTPYDQISLQRGFNLLVDGVHLNGNGASLVARTVLPTLQQLLPMES
jgi:lysophospholipase L1-like esterase